MLKKEMNMNNCLISVIIPVYNSEMYLGSCIKSVINQSYSNFELILVNDGSTDNSGIICNDFASKDIRIKVFHKENGGVSSARNYGLENANGVWISFIDSDDFIDRDFLESFEISEKTNSQLFISGYSIEDKQNSIVKKKIGCFNDVLFAEIVYKLDKERFLSSIWGKLFQSNIIKINNIFFDENIRFGEDTVFLWNYLLKINTLEINNSIGYHYMKYDTESLTSISNSFESLTVVNEEIFKLKKDFVDRIDNADLKRMFEVEINREYTSIWFRACLSMYENRFLKNQKIRIEKWILFTQKVPLDLMPKNSPIMRLTKKLLEKNHIILVDIIFFLRVLWKLKISYYRILKFFL